jgi:hypothetical protein
MDVFLILFLWGLGNFAVASPPVDLTDYEGKGSAQKIVKGAKKDPGISEREMIYVDNQDGVDSRDPALCQVKYKVAGRDRPGREGKTLVKLNQNQRVRFIRETKDHRWTMVEVVATRRKAWIPTSALLEKE